MRETFQGIDLLDGSNREVIAHRGNVSALIDSTHSRPATTSSGSSATVEPVELGEEEVQRLRGLGCLGE